VRPHHPRPTIRRIRVLSRPARFARTAVDSLPRAQVVGQHMKKLLPEPGDEALELAALRASEVLTAKSSRTPDSITY
jgi:hypothetical protein